MTTRNPLYAEPRVVTAIDDCSFYHTMEIPGAGVVQGQWDLRGNESQYLGNVSFKDRRVLEIGPASGFLTFFMESQGADVVSVEAPPHHDWDFYWNLEDRLQNDLKPVMEEYRRAIDRVLNSYWFAHRAFSSRARVCYASAHALPGELGTFDVSVLACILLHNRDPLRILESCARVTTDTVVIVELSPGEPVPRGPVLEFLPSATYRHWDTWWRFSPEFFIAVLRTMGFSDHRVTFHEQKYAGKPTGLFTIVASRKQLERTLPDLGPLDVQVNCPVERLKLRANASTHLPVTVRNLTDAPFSSFSRFPVYVSYRWRKLSGRIVGPEGIRASFSRTLGKGDEETLMVKIQAPAEHGSYVLEITMVKEEITWYDGKIPGLPLQIQVLVTP